MEELERIVGRIRKRWPGVEIWLRGDSGFCRDELLAWCEALGVEYVLGIAQNPRLKRSLAPEGQPALRGDVAGACRARGWRGRNAARSGSVCGPCGCRSTRASRKRASSGRCWPVSRACPCAVSSCTPAIVSSPVKGRRGPVCLQGGFQAKTSPNNHGSGDPYQASARIRRPTQHCQAIHPPQMDKTPPNLRLLRRSG